MIDTKDIYWLAGLLEGEGSFSWHRTVVRQGSGCNPQIRVYMSDRDVIKRVAKTLGATGKVDARVPRGNGSPHHKKTLYGICIVGHRAAGWMQILYPLMGERRQARIKEVLTEWRKTLPRGKWDRAKNAAAKQAALDGLKTIIEKAQAEQVSI